MNICTVNFNLLITRFDYQKARRFQFALSYQQNFLRFIASFYKLCKRKRLKEMVLGYVPEGTFEN